MILVYGIPFIILCTFIFVKSEKFADEKPDHVYSKWWRKHVVGESDME